MSYTLPLPLSHLELRAVLHLGLARAPVGVADLEHTRVAVVGELEFKVEVVYS